MPELLNQALDLALYGMGTVFVFLTVLVFLTSMMSRLVTTFSQSESEQPVVAAATGISPTTIAAVAAAVKQHRERNQ